MLSGIDLDSGMRSESKILFNLFDDGCGKFSLVPVDDTDMPL